MKLIAVLMLMCGLAGAQQTQKPLDGQPWDFGVWAGGGLSVPGGTKDTHLMNAGLRLGKFFELRAESVAAVPGSQAAGRRTNETIPWSASLTGGC